MNIAFDDQKYLQQLSEGDIHAFEMIFLHYQPMLVKFIDGFIKDEEHARDISQDIFVRLWDQHCSMTDIRSLKAFLYRSAKFAIYNSYDHTQVSRRYISDYLHGKHTTDDTEELVFASELKQLLLQVIDRMPEQRRHVFLMSREEGLSIHEIAEHLHISRRTVENHLTAALASLRKTVRLFVVLFLYLS